MPPPPTDLWPLLEPAWDAVSIYEGPEVYDTQVAAFPEPVRHVLAAYWCQSEVFNGGFHQLFYNDTGVLAHHAAEGFRAMGLPEFSDIITAAMSRLGEPYPRDRIPRMERLEAKRLVTADFDDLDDRFYDLLKLHDLDAIFLKHLSNPD